MEIDNSARTKAYTLRQLAKNEELDEKDAEWLEDYEASKKSKGKKASKILHMEEHSAEVEGSDQTVQVMMAAGEVARQDGRRVDKLLDIALNAMERSCQLQAQMVAQMMKRMEVSENSATELMMSIRTHYLRATEAENDTLILQRQAQIERMNRALEMGGGGDDDTDDKGPIQMFEKAIIEKFSSQVVNAAVPKVGG